MIHQSSIPVTNSLDAVPLRSSQRAELLAAISGLRLLAKAYGMNTEGSEGTASDDKMAWVIATDSEYVAKGITEWISA